MMNYGTSPRFKVQFKEAKIVEKAVEMAKVGK